METARGASSSVFRVPSTPRRNVCAGHPSVTVASSASVVQRISASHSRVMEGGTGVPLVIVNPTASQLADPVKRTKVVASLLRAVEARTGRTPVLADSSVDVARAALAAASDAPLVAVAGCDGTIRETAAALAGSGVPLAIVPAGTGNVFAAALGIPRRTVDAVRLIETADPTRIDLGTASWGASGAGHDAAADGSMTFGVACGTGF